MGDTMTTEELIEAIRAYYHDTSRTRAETREGLEDAGSEIEHLLDTLDDDEAEDPDA